MKITIDFSYLIQYVTFLGNFLSIFVAKNITGTNRERSNIIIAKLKKSTIEEIFFVYKKALIRRFGLPKNLICKFTTQKY